jgi:4-hydroxybenzoate polyprenyltransferase/phosphoserine phosphatase
VRVRWQHSQQADHLPSVCPEPEPANPPVTPSALVEPLAAPGPTLVVDLDGTLTATDTLVESFLRLARTRPLRALAALATLRHGRAAFKQRVFEQGGLDVQGLPWRTDLLAWLQEQRAHGRRLVLATAADERVAHAVASEHGLFDAVYASNGRLNLKGERKRDLIVQREGPVYSYAGDSRADLPVWRGASSAVLVGVSDDLARRVGHHTAVERRFAPASVGWGTWARALRLHQWLKNLLVFVPLLTSFMFWDPAKVLAAVLAFVCFGLMASGTYILNDLWDLEADRQHPRKRLRPFASGALPIAHGVAVAGGLLLAAALMAAWLSWSLLGVLGGYLVLTTAYSAWLKRLVLVDVVTLAMLYTARVLAGAVAIGTAVSPWLLAFSTLLFFSLALVKRCGELVSFREAGRLAAPGRDYRVADLVVLWPLGAGASVAAVVVFCLFIAAADPADYPRAPLLWLAAVCLLYWLGRLWIKTARAEMHDDPIVFTLRDRATRSVLLAMVVITVLAHMPGPA